MTHSKTDRAALPDPSDLLLLLRGGLKTNRESEVLAALSSFAGGEPFAEAFSRVLSPARPSPQDAGADPASSEKTTRPGIRSPISFEIRHLGRSGAVNFSRTIIPRDLNVIRGANASGKSTFIRALRALAFSHLVGARDLDELAPLEGEGEIIMEVATQGGGKRKHIAKIFRQEGMAQLEWDGWEAVFPPPYLAYEDTIFCASSIPTLRDIRTCLGRLPFAGISLLKRLIEQSIADGAKEIKSLEIKIGSHISIKKEMEAKRDDLLREKAALPACSEGVSKLQMLLEANERQIEELRTRIAAHQQKIAEEEDRAAKIAAKKEKCLAEEISKLGLIRAQIQEIDAQIRRLESKDDIEPETRDPAPPARAGAAPAPAKALRRGSGKEKEEPSRSAGGSSRRLRIKCPCCGKILFVTEAGDAVLESPSALADDRLPPPEPIHPKDLPSRGRSSSSESPQKALASLLCSKKILEARLAHSEKTFQDVKARLAKEEEAIIYSLHSMQRSQEILEAKEKKAALEAEKKRLGDELSKVSRQEKRRAEYDFSLANVCEVIEAQSRKLDELQEELEKKRRVGFRLSTLADRIREADALLTDSILSQLNESIRGLLQACNFNSAKGLSSIEIRRDGDGLSLSIARGDSAEEIDPASLSAGERDIVRAVIWAAFLRGRGLREGEFCFFDDLDSVDDARFEEILSFLKKALPDATILVTRAEATRAASETAEAD